jgi:hypothetical protein
VSEAKIDYLGTYLRELNKPQEQTAASEDRPAQQVVTALKDHSGTASIQAIHEQTGIQLLDLVPTLKGLEGLGVVKIDELDLVSLTPESSLLL